MRLGAVQNGQREFTASVLQYEYADGKTWDLFNILVSYYNLLFLSLVVGITGLFLLFTE